MGAASSPRLLADSHLPFDRMLSKMRRFRSYAFIDKTAHTRYCLRLTIDGKV